MADPHLVTFLADRDEPCPACTYNLRGLKTDRCPECNRELVLQIRLAEPRIGAWIAALAAAAAMLGFNLLILCYFFIEVIRQRRYGPDFKNAYSLIVFTVVAGVLLASLIKCRRRYGRLSTGAGLSLAVLAWVTTVISAWLFFSGVS